MFLGRSSLFFLLTVTLIGTAWGTIPESVRAVAESLHPHEAGILLGVGRQYGLNGDALRLLFVIRRIENGGRGVEMGVASNYPHHPARRYRGNRDASLRVQAQWAAGTIRKYYTGDLAAFAKRYCPPKAEHWTRMARCWMAKDNDRADSEL